VEAFRDQQAGVEHVTSLNFRADLTAMRPALTHTPQSSTPTSTPNRLWV
jgi:hypothetical protein